MRKLRLLPAVLLAVVVLPLTTSPPANAKGASDVVVSGPGVDDVRLGYTRDGTDVDVGSLAEVSGLYQIYGAAIATDDPGLTDTELGPRYVLTWYVGSDPMQITHVYPFTSQGAWHHIPYEDGGWIRGGPDLEQAMVDLGAEAPEKKAGAVTGGEVSTSSTAGGSGPRTDGEPTESSSPVPAGGWAGLAVLLVLGGAVAWWLRRRRTTLTG